MVDFLAGALEAGALEAAARRVRRKEKVSDEGRVSSKRRTRRWDSRAFWAAGALEAVDDDWGLGAMVKSEEGVGGGRGESEVEELRVVVGGEGAREGRRGFGGAKEGEAYTCPSVSMSGKANEKYTTGKSASLRLQRYYSHDIIPSSFRAKRV